ncbi:hypothetical protein [uncultured Megasphaera sp.]|uniref:hypothetical protein n=1 Tax=uncultured Megasphaera sp. TaxID=165188 RepID=UPI002625E984|nr:hypothetical protein [uncultured Megasphaera sp.]
MKSNHRFGKWRKATAALLVVGALLGTPCLPSALPTVSAAETVQAQAVQSPRWDATVRQGINDFIAAYGKNSPNYDKNNHPYAVFDFDNTTSILDVGEQLEVWQLDHLQFAVPPTQMKAVLMTGIPADKLDATYGADDGEGRQVTIRSVIDDAAKAYASLYKKGLIKPTGSTLSAKTQNDPDYLEFKAKMRWLYDAIGDTMDVSVSYPWSTYWYTGMTPQQVYDMAYQCDAYYGNPLKGQTWTKGKYTSPANYPSEAGNVSVGYKVGITVTPEMRELYSALTRNGIDCYICSASPIDAIRAAVSYFKVPGVKDVLAMTNKVDANGRYLNQYDYDFHPQTQGVGKAETLAKILVPKYKGHGPSFTAMDSQGDFNFCTEFKDTKAVLVINRTRTDDAALCAGIAAYQKKHGIDLAAANKNGDSLFLIQGRNENKGEFWNDDKTLLLGKKDASYLSDKATKAETELEQGKTIAQVLKDNTKLKDKYQGYKTR